MIDALGIDILREDIVHPRPRTFAGTREVIGVEDTDELALGIGDLEHLDLGVIHGHICERLELQAIELRSHTERTAAHVAQLEVRLDLFLVEGILGFAEFLGVEPPVPGLEFLAREIGVEEFLELGSFAFGCYERRCPHGLQERIDSLAVLSHAVLEDIVGRIVVAEELGALDTELHLADDDGFVVVVIVVVGAGGVVHQHLTAQLTVLAVLQHRCEGCALGREQPLTRMTGSSSVLGSSRLGALGQTFELRLVSNEELTVVRLGNDVTSELQREQVELLVDSFQAFLLLSRQVGTVVGKTLIGLGQQPHLLGCEVEALALVIDSLHAGEQFIVEDHVRRQLGQHRADLLGDSVHLVVAVGFEYVEEHTRHALQQLAVAVEGYDSVLKRRCLGVSHDGVYTGFVLTDSLLKGRQVMFGLHLIERRHAKRRSGLVDEGVGGVAC